MRIQNNSRFQDVIKSGGEWISSIEIENAAMGHPKVAEAAVIGAAHPRWRERPVLVVVPKDHSDPPGERELLEFVAPSIAKWWLPDAVLVRDELPHTATGKVLKKKLRELLKDFDLVRHIKEKKMRRSRL